MKIKILMLILVLILTIGVVSATEDNITSNYQTINNDENINISNDQSNKLLAENSQGTFIELSDLIESTPENNTLKLDKDYMNEGNVSKEGIIISKPITIDGNGHTLNADNLSRIFCIKSSNVILKDIIFKNGQYVYFEKNYYNFDQGAAVYFNYNCGNSTFINCSFINCFSESGTVYFDYNSNNNFINNCSFINCQSKYMGSAICSEANNNRINNTRFVNCSKNGESIVHYDFCSNCIVNNCSFIDCPNGRGIEYFCSENCIANNCTFINCGNTAIYFSRGYEIHDGGYGYYSGCTNCKINNCSFINCYSKSNGGAIIFYDNNENGTISNCIFINCQSDNGGAIYFYDYHEEEWYYYFSFEKAIIKDCRFINCKAKNGGSIYVGDYSYSNTVKNCSFMNSTAQIGGTIYWSGNKGKIENSNFTYSHALNGGAIYADQNINLKVTESNFKKNTADKFGSAVYGANIYKCNFSENTKPEIYNKYTPSIKARNTKVKYTEIYPITIYKNTGLLGKYSKVTIKINGKAYKTLYTNNNGMAKFKINQKPGTYKLSITAFEKTLTKNIIVKHIVSLKTVKVKKSSKKQTLQANLLKVNGKYLKNKQITFKFNGKIYKSKTNSKGIAKVTIKSSVLKKLKVGKKITYQATYLKDTVKKTVKVQK